jgi:hypothetical protein
LPGQTIFGFAEAAENELLSAPLSSKLRPTTSEVHRCFTLQLPRYSEAYIDFINQLFRKL